MSNPSDEPIYDANERAAILARMRTIIEPLYMATVQTRCHPFIEFNGLLREYLVLCTAAHNQGIDFTQANTHSGTALPMHPYQAAYLAEKLNCIYGPSLLQNPEVRNAFVETMFGGNYKLVPVSNDLSKG